MRDGRRCLSPGGDLRVNMSVVERMYVDDLAQQLLDLIHGQQSFCSTTALSWMEHQLHHNVLDYCCYLATSAQPSAAVSRRVEPPRFDREGNWFKAILEGHCFVRYFCPFETPARLGRCRGEEGLNF